MADYYGTVLGIHASAMGSALLLFVASELLLILARRGQKWSARTALLARRFAGHLAFVGVLGGITLVFIGGWSLATPWLVVSLALIATLMVIERKVVGSWEARAQSALRGDPSSTQIQSLAREKGALIGRAIMITLFAIIAGIMATKPDLTFFP